MKKIFVLLIASILVGVSIGAALLLIQRKNTKNDAVVIGAIMPLTGDYASYGIAIKNGIDVALNKVNVQGGINGKLLKVSYEDSKASPMGGVTAINKLISIDHVNAIIGAVASSVTLAIAPIAEKEKVVLLSPASSSPKITKAGDYIFRNYPSDTLEGKLVAKYANHKNYRKAAMFTINNDYGKGLASVFRLKYMSLGGVILFEDEFNEGDIDFKIALTKIKAVKPDCIFIVGYSKELGTLVKQAKELGIKSQFLSTVNFYDHQTIVAGGDAVNGVVFSSPVFDSASSKPWIQEFVHDYKRSFGITPDVWAAHGYDALLLIAHALKDRGDGAENIKKSLYSIANFKGVSGITTFDENGDVLKEAKFLTVKNGKFVPLGEEY